VKKIHKRLCAAYGSCAVDRSTAGRWVQSYDFRKWRNGAACSTVVWASWYREGMHALVSHWRKAVDVDGDYVERITFVKETSSYTMREFRTF
jgi:hypothetical protein